ncbi:LOW QUALITY PROTEIN: hypothetical protein V2J09_021469 [Rumex salicifolius]
MSVVYKTKHALLVISKGMKLDLKDVGEAFYVTGIELFSNRLYRILGLCQNSYLTIILERFNMTSHDIVIKSIQTLIIGRRKRKCWCTYKEQRNTCSHLGILVTLRGLSTHIQILGDVLLLKNTFGYVFALSSNATFVEKCLSNHNCIISMEPELIAFFEATIQGLWL